MTVTTELSLLVFAVVDAVNAGWGSTATIVRLAAATLLLGAFVVTEQRQRDPLMTFSIFALRTLRAANIVGLLIGMSNFSMFFFISPYLQAAAPRTIALRDGTVMSDRAILAAGPGRG